MGISKNLKRLIKDKNITQKELAALVDVTPQMISRIEKGFNLPGVNTLVKMTRALNCSANDLLEGEE